MILIFDIIISNIIFPICVGLFFHLWSNKFIEDGEVFSFVSKFLNWLDDGNFKTVYDSDNFKGIKHFIYKSTTCSTCMAIQHSIYLSLIFVDFSFVYIFIFIVIAGFTAYYSDNKII